MIIQRCRSKTSHPPVCSVATLNGPTLNYDTASRGERDGVRGGHSKLRIINDRDQI